MLSLVLRGEGEGELPELLAAGLEKTARYHVKEDDDKYVVYVEVPGAGKDDVEVYARESEVYVRAVNRIEAPGLPKVYRVRVRLEEPIDVESVKARYINGLVVVECRKKLKGARVPVE